MRLVHFLVLAFFLVSDIEAKEISGVQFSDTSELADVDQSLILNGVGVRKKYFVSVYAAALYLTERSPDPHAIIKSEGPKRIVMQMLHSEIPRDKLTTGWNHGFEANHNESDMNALRQRLDRFNTYFTDLHRGDRVILDYLPARGTRVTVKSLLQGTIPGKDFFQGLLKV